ncbi:hypothetical protein MMC25_006890 [Agyrium rufum]|nr:hypothetical protein [Agyrium rufum]
MSVLRDAPPIVLPDGFSFSIRKLSEPYYPIYDCSNDAFSSDSLNSLIWTNVDPKVRRNWTLERMKKNDQDPKNQAQRWDLKITKHPGTAEEEVVAAATWLAPDVPEKEELTEEQKEAKKEKAKKDTEEMIASFPEGLGHNDYRTLEDRVIKMVHMYLGEDVDQKWWNLRMLATRPGYQRRGFAAMLIQWGLDQAEKHSQREDGKDIQGAYIIATPSGLPAYLKAGCTEVASVTHNIGGEDIFEGYKHVMLIRRAPGRKGGL